MKVVTAVKVETTQMTVMAVVPLIFVKVAMAAKDLTVVMDVVSLTDL